MPYNMQITRLFGRKVVLFCITLLLTFLFYNNVLVNGFVLDDVAVITGNKFVKQGIKGIDEIWQNDLFMGIYGKKTDIAGGRYRPLPLTLFAIVYPLFGENPFPYHLLSIILYAVASFLFGLLSLELMRRYGVENEKALRIAGIAIPLFIVHPVHTEVVANIKSIDEIMCAIFSFLSLIQIVNNSKKKHFVYSAIFYFMALASKETALFLPLLVFFINEHARKPSVATFYMLSFVFYFILRYNAIGNPLVIKPKYEYDDPYLKYSFIEKIPVLCYIAIAYLMKILLPVELSYDYSYNQIPVLPYLSIKGGLSIIVILVFLIMTIYELLRKRLTGFLALSYIAFYLPVSNVFMSTGVSMAERFIFLASAYAIFIAAIIMVKIFSSYYQSFYYLLAIPLILLLGAITYTRNRDWKDNLTLFKADVRKVPMSARAHYYYGRELWFAVNAGKLDTTFLDTAIAEIKKALEILPTFYHARYDLGLIYKRKRNIPAALDCFKKVLAQEPLHINSTYELGFLYSAALNKTDSGIILMERAINWGYDGDDGYLNLGIAWAIKGDLHKALHYFLKGAEKFPSNPLYYLNIAQTYKNIGDELNYQKYIKMYQQISQKKP